MLFLADMEWLNDSLLDFQSPFPSTWNIDGHDLFPHVSGLSTYFLVVFQTFLLALTTPYYFHCVSTRQALNENS